MHTLEKAIASASARVRLAVGTRQPSESGLRMRACVDTGEGAVSGKADAFNCYRTLSHLKEAAPLLGIRPRLVFAIDWLVGFTRQQDWEPGATPIVWPSQALQCEVFGLSVTQVKQINRQLIAAGLVIMRDSGNRKRFGRRDTTGRIIEAYGFDLSPLRSRASEIASAAAAARARRSEMALLKRQAGSLRTELRSAVLAAYSFLPAGGVEAAMAALVTPRPRLDLRHPEPLRAHVASLRRAIEELLRAVRESRQTGQEAPEGAENRPHQYKYESTESEEKTVTVLALEGVACHGPVSSPSAGADTAAADPLRVTPEDIVRIAPRMAAYLPRGKPGWSDVVEAADWLRAEIGVPKPTWVDACLAMGRDRAAVAVAVVSARPSGHIRKSNAAYFAGMVKRARHGQLDLARSIAGMMARECR